MTRLRRSRACSWRRISSTRARRSVALALEWGNPWHVLIPRRVGHAAVLVEGSDDVRRAPAVAAGAVGLLRPLDLEHVQAGERTVPGDGAPSPAAATAGGHIDGGSAPGRCGRGAEPRVTGVCSAGEQPLPRPPGSWASVQTSSATYARCEETRVRAGPYASCGGPAWPQIPRAASNPHRTRTTPFTRAGIAPPRPAPPSLRIAADRTRRRAPYPRPGALRRETGVPATGEPCQAAPHGRSPAAVVGGSPSAPPADQHA